MWLAPSARGQQSNVDEIFAMLRAHVLTGGDAVVVTRAPVLRSGSSSSSPKGTPRQRFWNLARNPSGASSAS